MYTTTSIEHNCRIVMQFIFHFIYDLNSIKVENDNDVLAFLKKQQKLKRSPIIVKVVNMLPLITLDLNHTNVVTSKK